MCPYAPLLTRRRLGLLEEQPRHLIRVFLKLVEQVIEREAHKLRLADAPSWSPARSP